MPEGGHLGSPHEQALRKLALRALGQLLPTHADAAELAWLAPSGHDPLDGAAIQRLRQAAGKDSPLLRVGDSLGLSDGEALICFVVLAAELDVRVARAVASLQGTGGAAGPARPTVGLLARLSRKCGLSPGLDDADAVSQLLASPAFASGLLQLAGGGRGAAETEVLMPLPLVAAVGERLARDGIHPVEFGAASVAPLSVPDWHLPATLRRDLTATAQEALRLPRCVVVVRAPSVEEALPIAALLSREIGLRPVELVGTGAPRHMNLPARLGMGLEPWLTAAGALPVIPFDAAPGDLWRLPGFHWYRGPVLIAGGIEGEVDTDGRPRLEIKVPWPSLADRAAVLQQRIAHRGAALAETDAADLARRCRVGFAVLHRVADSVDCSALAEGDTLAAMEAAVAAAGAVGSRSLAPLAQAIPGRVTDDAFVATAPLQRDMALLLARCQARESLTDTLGAAFLARYSPGVKALFVGASGTGKTLAAQWLATRLGKPLFRVDLSAVSSKYIGETEKNLSQLLARAEGIDAVLLFDEADSLFGARTDVKQANDRFANAQTNYLLARIESFEGTALLTSNSQERFDHAFLRRLDTVIEFPLPSSSERRALWDVHLGKGHAMSAAQLNRLAAEVDFAGGHIRNAVLSAALLARIRMVPLIEWRDVLDACSIEYAKLGRRPPDGLCLSEG